MRATSAAEELLKKWGNHADVEDLASDIMVWILRRDQRSQARGDAAPPKYTAECLRWVGIDLIRRAQKSEPQRVHKRIRVPMDEVVDLPRLMSHLNTPERIVLAEEAVELEIERRLRAGRLIPL